MNKFWQWMWKCDYAPPFVKWVYNNKNLNPGRMAVEPTPQMLIGYKLEYVRDHATFWKREKPYWSGDQMTIDCRLSMLWDCIDIAKEIDDIIMIIDNEKTT